MIPNGMRAAIPPPTNSGARGRKPSLLTDDKVKVLLANPNEWYIIGDSDKWISGVKANIESMTQSNISHLADKGKFVIIQRKNTNGKIDIYCRYTPINEEIL